MDKVIVSVTNDLATDQRVFKECKTLMELGFEVVLLGRILPNSMPIERPYTTKRFRLLFNKGPLFYAEINTRIFFYLMVHHANILLANDLDTLAANFVASRLKRIPLVYDSHEYFTGVPELQGRPFAKKVWEIIEAFIFPKLKYVYTVNKTIADIYIKKYKVDVKVVRNVAMKWRPLEKKSRQDLGLPLDKKIIIFQSAGINIQRGMEELVEAMQFIENTLLLIIGNGDALPVLKQMVQDLRLEEKVSFYPKMYFDDMMNYTSVADLGICIDKDTNLNYKYSLPNKIMEYIMAGIPILTTPLVEIKPIIEKYKVGYFLDSYDPKIISKTIANVLNNTEGLKICAENTKAAANDLCWENEENVIKSMFFKIGTE